MATTSNATFMELPAWKALLGIQTLTLCHNPESGKFSLRIDNTRNYLRIDGALVIGGKIDKSQDMAMRIDEDADPSDLDSVCLVAVKASNLVECDSI